MIKTISIDLESYSDRDLSKCGVYKYAQSPDFEILLFGYSVNGGEVKVIDVAHGEKIPDEILKALTDERVEKWAYNATFERVCLSEYLRKRYPLYHHSYSVYEDTVGDYLDPHGWKCTMTWAAYLGLPMSLKAVGEVLGLEEQKLDAGKALIKYFSGNNPDDLVKWEMFKKYNKRDVEVEMSIQQKLKKFPVPDFVWEEYWLDQEINDRGVRVDTEFVDAAIYLDELSRIDLESKMKTITGIENPNSVYQLLEWLEKYGYTPDSLDKSNVAELLKTAKDPVKSVLELRQQLAKTSVKKYRAMQTAVCSDSRARGMFQFYGANRTGREAGRLIQLQNLPQNHIDALAETRELIKYGSHDEVKLFYDNIPDILSQLIRTAFVPRPGYKFIVADFAAIEARVIAWLANEKWRMDAFAKGEDIYCESASRIFGVPVVKHGVNGHLRQKGKVAELACGYSGSVGAMKAMGGADMSDEELKQIVEDWRAASPNIVKLWYDVEAAAVKAVSRKTRTETHGIIFSYESGFLFITLPSGRRLAYVKPKIATNRFGRDAITYEGLSASKRWERLETYSGKLVENIVQAIARDLLFHAMKTLSYCFIVAHIHDEMIIECDRRMSVEKICEQMAQTPDWARGLLLRADGYECEFYKKD